MDGQVTSIPYFRFHVPVPCFRYLTSFPGYLFVCFVLFEKIAIMCDRLQFWIFVSFINTLFPVCKLCDARVWSATRKYIESPRNSMFKVQNSEVMWFRSISWHNFAHSSISVIFLWLIEEMSFCYRIQVAEHMSSSPISFQKNSWFCYFLHFFVYICESTHRFLPRISLRCR